MAARNELEASCCMYKSLLGQTRLLRPSKHLVPISTSTRKTMATNGTTTTTTTATTNGSANDVPPKIKLYTNHRCPYAHRAHIVLTELNLPYEETLIDLDTPRPDWYLQINPRGLVPAIQLSHPTHTHDRQETLTESAVVATFLAEAFQHDKALVPSAPLARARMNFFIDTWNTKVTSHLFAFFGGDLAAPEKEDRVAAWVAAVEKEVEPLLRDAGPFFGGSRTVTLAEAMAGPMLLRMYALSEDGELIPKSLAEGLGKLAGFSRWAAAVRGSESVRAGIFEEGDVVAATKKRVEKMRAKKA